MNYHQLSVLNESFHREVYECAFYLNNFKAKLKLGFFVKVM